MPSSSLGGCTRKPYFMGIVAIFNSRYFFIFLPKNRTHKTVFCLNINTIFRTCKMRKFGACTSKKCVCHEFVTNFFKIFARMPYFIVCLRLLFFGDFCKKSENTKKARVFNPCIFLHFRLILLSFFSLFFKQSFQFFNFIINHLLVIFFT